MKQQIQRLDTCLRQLNTASRVNKILPHTVVLGWLVYASASGSKYKADRLVIEEVEMPVGDKMERVYDDLSKDMRFLFHLRIKTPLLRDFRRKFNIKTTEFKFPGTMAERKMILWYKVGGPQDIAVDLYKDLAKFSPLLDEASKALKDLGDVGKLIMAHKVRKPARQTRAKAVMDLIYDVFEEAQLEPVLSTEFEFLEDQYSRPTIIKAKKMMGIESVKRMDGWYWLPPTLAPTEALQQAYTAAQNKAQIVRPVSNARYIDRPSVQDMKMIMEKANYDILSSELFEQMAQYKRITILKAKQTLRIGRFKVDGKWRWVYPAPEIKEWVMDQLAAGPLKFSTLSWRAKHDKNWTREVLRAVKIVLPEVESRFIEGKHHWALDNFTPPVVDDGTIKPVEIKPIKQAEPTPLKHFNIAMLGDEDEES